MFSGLSSSSERLQACRSSQSSVPEVRGGGPPRAAPIVLHMLVARVVHFPVMVHGGGLPLADHPCLLFLADRGAVGHSLFVMDLVGSWWPSFHHVSLVDWLGPSVPDVGTDIALFE